MCHSVRVRLSPTERKEAARLTGILLPVYASIVLLLAGVYVTQTVRGGTIMAASSQTPASAIASTER